MIRGTLRRLFAIGALAVLSAFGAKTVRADDCYIGCYGGTCVYRGLQPLFSRLYSRLFMLG